MEHRRGRCIVNELIARVVILASELHWQPLAGDGVERASSLTQEEIQCLSRLYRESKSERVGNLFPPASVKPKEEEKSPRAIPVWHIEGFAACCLREPCP